MTAQNKPTAINRSTQYPQKHKKSLTETRKHNCLKLSINDDQKISALDIPPSGQNCTCKQLQHTTYYLSCTHILHAARRQLASVA